MLLIKAFDVFNINIQDCTEFSQNSCFKHSKVKQLMIGNPDYTDKELQNKMTSTILLHISHIEQEANKIKLLL